MSDSHPAEIERLRIAAQGPVVPGSFQEDAALERIAQLRLEERDEITDTFEERRRRARRHFRSDGRI